MHISAMHCLFPQQGGRGCCFILASPPAVRVRQPGVLHSCGTTTAGARHCTSLIYSGSRPNQYTQDFLVRAVPRARYFDSQASAFARWPSRPLPRFLGRCHNSDRNFNRLKLRLELHDCLHINTHCDVTLILPPTFKRMHYMRLKLDTRLTNSL